MLERKKWQASEKVAGRNKFWNALRKDAQHIFGRKYSLGSQHILGRKHILGSPCGKFILIDSEADFVNYREERMLKQIGHFWVQ